jgi:hypothetical protein
MALFSFARPFLDFDRIFRSGGFLKVRPDKIYAYIHKQLHTKKIVDAAPLRVVRAPALRYQVTNQPDCAAAARAAYIYKYLLGY